LAVDAAGGVYLVGNTSSADFPTAGALQAVLGGGSDAFVAKVAPDGARLEYATYLGGSGGERGRGVAVDASGSAHVVGYTTSTDFPAAPLPATSHGAGDGFVARLAAGGGSLLHSTYLGGSGLDEATGVALDRTGTAHVVGDTGSRDFPTAGLPAPGGTQDVFLARIVPGNAPPTVGAGGPYEVAEGNNVVLRATGTDPEGRTLVYAWDLDGDGSFERVGASVRFPAADLDGPSTRTVTVKATDPGGASATAPAIVGVRNARPSAVFHAPAEGAPGETVTLSLTDAIDPSPSDRAAGFTHRFACAHGPQDNGRSPTFACQLPNARGVNVSGTVCDKDGACTSYDARISIPNRPPVVSLSSPTAGQQFPVGAVVRVSAPFTDKSSYTDRHTCRVEWGDGSASDGTVGQANGEGTCRAEHAYAAPGSRTIKATVRDEWDAEGSASVGIVVTAP
jgi:hypothetical protein